jgi:glycosyltransferase involved in cell wall biosynthesis
LLKRRCGIPYVIDYIDPWIYPITGQERKSWKARVSHWLARRLEPIAVGQADGITGVAAGYYEDVLERHPHLQMLPRAGIPYGCEPADHDYVEQARRRSGLLDKLPRGTPCVFVYAGALLPRARATLRGLLEACRHLRFSQPDLASRLHLLFVGTGSPDGKSVAPMAAELQVSDLVTEIPDRQPYLEVLATLSQAHAVLVLGSTERHYTASKIFQAMYSRRPVLAMLHEESSAVGMLRSVPGVELITFRDEQGVRQGVSAVAEALGRLLDLPPAARFSRERTCLDQFSARRMTERLADCFHEVLARASR